MNCVKHVFECCFCLPVEIAQECGQHGGLGQDLVAMCVNDVLAQGAEPLFFLDYFSCGSLDVDVAASVVGGIAKACEMAGCALLGKQRDILAMMSVKKCGPYLDPSMHRWRDGRNAGCVCCGRV